MDQFGEADELFEAWVMTEGAREDKMPNLLTKMIKILIPMLKL